MSNRSIFPNPLVAERKLPELPSTSRDRDHDLEPNHVLPVSITRAASKQTYYTIRFLVDRDRTLDAYRAYAYFRWVDDRLDQELSTASERTAFIESQQALLRYAFQGESPFDLLSEEHMLLDLIRNNHEQNSGLQLYLGNMMAVMSFDADRRGRLISQQELTQYSRNLATAVTEALHYFIGHDDPAPQIPSRYLAVTGAHITHMLRDTFEDIAAGYFNISYEFLEQHGLDACDIRNDAYRIWVQRRVKEARTCFEAGKEYLAQVENLRCRLAGYAYTARFEGVLDTIEQDGYKLRPQYHEHKRSSGGLGMSWSILSTMLKSFVRGNT